jgi:uncharacterized protein (TIGR02145 family)
MKVFVSIGITSFIMLLSNSCESVESDFIDYTGQAGTITDIEGNIYNTTGIGSQIWMAENLKSTTLNNGIEIPEIKDITDWTYSVAPGLCYYNNDSANYKKTYGPLYNFYVVSSEIICPIGWRVPAESDWKKLSAYLGGDDIAGGKLKQSGGTTWKGTNVTIINNYSFNALPGGFRRHSWGTFMYIGINGYWWTSSSEGDFQASIRSMNNSEMNLTKHTSFKTDGYSIRCIKDKGSQ